MLYRVVAPRFVAGAEVEQGVVVRAAPIIRWAIGNPLVNLQKFCDEHQFSLALVPTSKILIYTAQLSYSGGLDVSRLSGDQTFAPSWSILKPALDLRRRGLETEATWREYVEAYTAEMRISYTRRQSHWLTQLVDGAVFKCYCAKHHLPRCHRILLAGFLVKVGAAHRLSVVYGGEL